MLLGTSIFFIFVSPVTKNKHIKYVSSSRAVRIIVLVKWNVGPRWPEISWKLDGIYVITYTLATHQNHTTKCAHGQAIRHLLANEHELWSRLDNKSTKKCRSIINTSKVMHAYLCLSECLWMFVCLCGENDIQMRISAHKYIAMIWQILAKSTKSIFCKSGSVGHSAFCLRYCMKYRDKLILPA